MKQLKTIFFAMSAALVMSSCYQHQYILGTLPPDTPPDSVKWTSTESRWNHYIILGAGTIKESDVREMVGDAKVYEIYTRQEYYQVLIHYLTLGIYSPTITTVRK